MCCTWVTPIVRGEPPTTSPMFLNPKVPMSARSLGLLFSSAWLA